MDGEPIAAAESTTAATEGTALPPVHPNEKQGRAERGRRLRRRGRRVASLLFNLPLVVRFSGGLGATLRIVWELWRARGLGSVAGWATTAVAHSRFLDPRRYAVWSKRRERPTPGAGSMLVVCSTLGVPASDAAAFLRLLLPPRHERVDLLVLVDASAATDIPAGVEKAVVPEVTLGAILSLVQSRTKTYDFIALPAPGCVAAEDIVPPSVTEDGELFYGDEDRIDVAGERRQPFFKPSLSPDLLMASDYFGCVIMPKSLVEALPQKFASDFHSLTLRLVEVARRSIHLDAILAHRFVPTTNATMPEYLPTFLANRYGEQCGVQQVAGNPPWRCTFGNDAARVSVIVPTRDRLELLRECIEGLFATNHGNFEVIVLDNDSAAPETLAWFEEAQARWPSLRVVAAPGEFNWSRLNNLGIAHANGDAFVFLNNDTVPRSENWLARLADVALRPDVGAVGALLLYPSGRIQHAGVVIGEGRWTDHVYRGDYPNSADHVFVAPHLPRNVAAVTGACMAFSRRTLERIGDFDENYAVAGNDVEICVRALQHGLVNVYLPDVVLLHLESQTRGRRDPLPDVVRLEAFLAKHFPEDPFFNRHLASAPLYFTQRSAA